MKASPACIGLIRQCEGFSPVPYLDPVGIPTIGYGSTFYPGGRPVTMSDQPIDEFHATEIMRSTLSTYEDAVYRYVQVPMTKHQFDALVSFTYNVGTRNFKTSTMLKKINARDFAGAAEEFPKWTSAGGRRLKGLVKRRELERRLFLGL